MERDLHTVKATTHAAHAIIFISIISDNGLFEQARAHLREKTMAPNPGISGSSGARMMRATPETCRSVTLGTSLVPVPVESSTAISMLEWPDSLKAICAPRRCLVYLKCWTLSLRLLMVYPKVLEPKVNRVYHCEPGVNRVYHREPGKATP